MTQAVAPHPDRIQIQAYDGFFPQGQSCGICHRRDVQPILVVDRIVDAFFGCLLPVPEKFLQNRSLVYASCHPNAFYHLECLRGRVSMTGTCPLDRTPINPTLQRVG